MPDAPFRIGKGVRGHAEAEGAPAVGQGDLLRFGAVYDESGEIAVQHPACRIFQIERQDGDGGLFRHADRQRAEGSGKPGPVINGGRLGRIGLLQAEGVPAVKLRTQGKPVADVLPAGQKGSVQRHLYRFPRLRAAAEVPAGGKEERGMQVAKRHAGNELVQTGDLLRTVEAPVAVPLVDDVVVLRVQPSGKHGMATEDIQGAMIIPAPVDIAGAAFVTPDVAELGIDIGLPLLAVPGFEIPGRAGVDRRILLEEEIFPRPSRQVAVPGVEVGGDMPHAATDRIVFDQPAGIEILGLAVHPGHPFLSFRQVAALLVFLVDRSEKPPGFVEEYPGKNGGMVVIAPDHLPHGIFGFRPQLRPRLAPAVGHVGHDEDA